jgi:hypothetical protein
MRIARSDEGVAAISRLAESAQCQVRKNEWLHTNTVGSTIGSKVHHREIDQGTGREGSRHYRSPGDG